MDLTDRQRKFAFAGIVVALAAAGVYLTLPTGGDPADVPSSPPASAPAAPASTPTPTPPPGIGSAVTPDSFDIYRLLPFSQRDFAAAADLAQRFVAAYGTYRFDEDPQTFTRRLQGMVTDQLRAEIERSAAAPGLLEQRRQDQAVAQSTATLNSIRDIETSSVIFLVTGDQQLTSAGSKTQERQQYAVTVNRDGGSWRVFAFEPADAGQAGDTG